jgi:hypothetical protein
MPPHARAGERHGRGHRFAAYPRCWADLTRVRGGWRMRRHAFNLAAAVAAPLLLACPVRNLQSLRECFSKPAVVMDVPAEQLHLEANLLILQVCLAALAGIGLSLGAQDGPVRLIGAGVCWALVAVGGFVWDKALGNFVGATLSTNSALGCVLERRSAHTHTMLTNGPLLLAGLLAVWVVWELRARRAEQGRVGRND